MTNILQTINEWSPVIFMVMIGFLLFLCKKRIDVVENELAALECRLPSEDEIVLKKVILKRLLGADFNARGGGFKMITDFLKTETSKEDLKITLKVLKEFKECSSKREWLLIPCAAWAKLEQLEEYLSYLVDGTPLSDDTLEYMNSSISEDISHGEVLSEINKHVGLAVAALAECDNDEGTHH